MEREIIKVPEDLRNEFSGTHDVEFNSEVYSFIEDILVLGDGECHDLIWKRESDRRYFRFGYQYYDYNYYYQENLEEVFPEQIIKTIYK